MAVLSTWSDLPIVAPLVGIGRSSHSLTAGVGLGEITDRALMHMRGNEAEAALGQSAMKIGDVAAVEDGLLARLRRDEFVLLGKDGRAALDRLAGMVGGSRVTLTDITHGRCALLLVGKEVAEVLPKVCGQDFGKFPNLHAAQTSLAKVRTLIIRADMETTPAYGLFVDRSLAAYVWNVVLDAAQEFGGVGLSEDGLNTLRTATLW